MSRLAELQQRFGRPRVERLLRIDLPVLRDPLGTPETLTAPALLRVGDVVILDGEQLRINRVLSRPPSYPPPSHGWPEFQRAVVQLGAPSWEARLAWHEHSRRYPGFVAGMAASNRHIAWQLGLLPKES